MLSLSYILAFVVFVCINPMTALW